MSKEIENLKKALNNADKETIEEDLKEVDSIYSNETDEDGFIHLVMWRLFKIHIHKWRTVKSKFGVPKNRTCKRCGAYEIYGTHTKWNKIR